MIDYLDMLDDSRATQVEHAASAPVFYENLRKRKRRASLEKRATDTTSTTRRHRNRKKGSAMAKRRKKRSPAQIAATKKMIRANRRKHRGAAEPSKRKRGKGKRRGRGKRFTVKLPTRRKNRRRSAVVVVSSGKRRRRRKLKLPRTAKRLTIVARERGKTKRKSKAGKRKSGKRKSPKRVAAGKKAARTRKRNKAARAGKRRSPKRGKRKSGRRKRRLSSTAILRRHSRRRRTATVKRLENAEMYATERRRSRHSRRNHRRRPTRRGRRSGAMENPMDATELFLGSLFGLVGFLAGDVTDRLIATHKLVDTGTKNAAGLEVYGDNPPTTGSYAGLFNPTAICAPMNLPRWANAVLVPGVVFLTAKYVQSKNVRAALQFGAFGYMARTVGKGLIDGVAMLVRPTMMGQQLYDGEMRAQLLKSNGGNNQAPAVKDLPAAGFGQTKQLAAAPCKCGGSCKDCQKTTVALAGTGKAGVPGTGYPSMPREVAPTGNTANANAPIPPPATRPAPPATVPTQQPPAPINERMQAQFLSGPKFKPFGGVDYDR